MNLTDAYDPEHRIDLEGLARILGGSRRHAARTAREIPHLRIGRKMWFRISDVEAYLAERLQQPMADDAAAG